MGLLVLSLFLTLMWLSNQVIKQFSDDIELSKNLSQLEQLVDLMTESSKKYQQNAPRDYESYNRDLKVFYARLKDNIASLNELTEKSTHDYFNRKATAGFLVQSEIRIQNQQSFKQLVSLKQEFDKGYKEQIGDNIEEPRLEWANDFIVNDSSGLFAQVKDSNRKFQALLQAHKKATFSFNNMVSVVIAIVFIVLLFWINQTIVKRILRVAKACKEVSLGNYGLQVKDKHTDEIGRLVKDFNLLSSRLKSVLSILNELNNSHNQQQALNVIKKETQTLIDASSLYLLTPKNKGYAIKSYASTIAKNDITSKELMMDDSCVDWIGTEKDYLLINDVLAHTISHKNSHMAKYLLHSTNANSILVIKISDKDHQGLLLIGKSEKNGFSEQHAETLNSLNSLFGRSLLQK